MQKITGLLFNGKSAQKQQVSLEVDDNGKTLIANTPNKTFHFSQLMISPRAGNARRYLTLPSGWLFETDNNDEVDALINRFGYKKASTAHCEPWLIRITVLAIALLLSWSGIHFGLPGLARHVAFMIPTETLVKMGQDAFKQMDQQHFQKSNIKTARQKHIEQLFYKLLPGDQGGFEFKLHIRNAPEIGANAFALSSGDIIVTDDLIKLAEKDEQLAGVLLHEIGHVELRHGMQGTAQKSILALTVIAVSGDINSAGTLLAAIPALLLNAGYTRNMEWEADGYALNEIKRRNLDPLLMADMLEKITKAGKVSHSRYWSTHPQSEKRIERIRSTAIKTPTPAI